ncbi:MAG: alkyl hydroperoxide reductase subunit F [Streptococcaceae bacterium]|nr:alkyl hydroperoxide reductase subunit F [Streptococcaceae bacterium]
MILEQSTKEQLIPYLNLLENDIILKVDATTDSKVRQFVDEIASLSSRIQIIEGKLPKTPAFSIERVGHVEGVIFAGLPLGHEFNSLVLALVQVSGRTPKVDDKLIKRIQQINTKMHFDSYISLTCHNCPEVVQALNIMSIINPLISHTMIEGSMFQAEIEEKGIMAVPTVFKDGEEFASGRMNLEEILEKILGGASAEEFENKDPYDVLVVGGGPAGASAAIYAARKGIRTGLVAEKFGGQPLETLGIENLISQKYIEGPKLVEQLEEHVKEYPVDLMKQQSVKKLEKKEMLEVTLKNGAVLKTKTAIIATGAKWRDLNIPGEKELKNKGIAYCPHCDGPLFKGKDIAVVGGGNSGIEAAIDLAGIVNHVTVLEFLPELKADEVLQKRLYSLPNVTVLTNVETKEIIGETKVQALEYTNRENGEIQQMNVGGVFILIGLVPNTSWLKDTVEQTSRGEIVTDKNGATSLTGVFAAGDCTDSTYKQIIVSMGSGATAALGAFDYLIRN